MTLLPSCLFSCPKRGLDFLSDSSPQDCDLLGVAWPFSVFGNTLAIVPSKESNDVLIGCTVLGEVTVRFSMDSGGLKEAFNNHNTSDYYHLLPWWKLLYTVRNKEVTFPDMIPTNADNFLYNSTKNLPKKYIPWIVCLRVLVTFFQWPVSGWFTTHYEWKVLCTIALTLFFLNNSLQMNTLLIAALSMLQKGLHFLSDSIQATDWLQCVWHSTSFNNPGAFLWLVNLSPYKNIKALETSLYIYTYTQEQEKLL